VNKGTYDKTLFSVIFKLGTERVLECPLVTEVPERFLLSWAALEESKPTHPVQDYLSSLMEEVFSTLLFFHLL